MPLVEDITKHLTSQKEIFDTDIEDLNDINKKAPLVDVLRFVPFRH